MAAVEIHTLRTIKFSVITTVDKGHSNETLSRMVIDVYVIIVTFTFILYFIESLGKILLRHFAIVRIFIWEVI